MGIFDKLFRRNKNVETEEVEKVEEKKEELKEEIQEEIKEEVKVESTENTENIEKVENEVVEEATKVEEPVKVNISQRLTKSKEGFFSKLKNIFTSKSKIDDSIYEELEDLLIQSDVGLGMTTNLINDLEKKVKANKISETSEVYEILKGLMSEFLLSQDSKVHLKDNRINVILIVGVNGVGKTTTIGKLALKYKKLGKKVLLGAGDTFRAAAVEQLEEWARRADVDIVKGREGADPASVVYDTLSKAEATKADVVIIDTAGRLHNKANLMRELEKINNIMKEKNYRIVNLDSIIVIQKPKLRPHIDSIRDNIAKILEIEPELVNVKAKTEEKLGFTGDETGVKSYCVVLLEKDNVR